MSKQNPLFNDSVVVLSYMYLSVNRDPHTHTHKSSIFDEKGADEQRSLLTGTEKCTSGVNSEVAARTGNNASWHFRPRCVPGISRPPKKVAHNLFNQLPKLYPLYWDNNFASMENSVKDILRQSNTISSLLELQH